MSTVTDASTVGSTVDLFSDQPNEPVTDTLFQAGCGRGSGAWARQVNRLFFQGRRREPLVVVAHMPEVDACRIVALALDWVEPEAARISERRGNLRDT